MEFYEIIWNIKYKLGNLEHDDVPTIDNSIASMSPRTFDEIPVSTVFAEEKTRELLKPENFARKTSTDSNRSSNRSRPDSRKLSRESKKSNDSKKSSDSRNSTKNVQQKVTQTAKKLKKELEDTIRKRL